MEDISTVTGARNADPSKKSSIPRKHFWKNAQRYFREYSRATGIHGIRFIAEERTMTEKVFWLLILTIAFSGCTYMIKQIYHKWDTSPVTVVFASAETPIFEIPFPAVTICPEIKVRKDVFDYTATINKLRKGQENLTEKEITYLNYMDLLCDEAPGFFLTYNRAIPTLNNITDDFYNFMLNSTDISSLILECYWMGYVYTNCSDIFMPTVTDAGLCFTINMLNKNYIFMKYIVTPKNLYQSVYETNWTIDDGYPPIINKSFWYSIIEEFPKRALLADARNSLTVVLRSSKNDVDYMCNYNPEGYRVSLHAPMSYPLMNQQYFKVPFDSDVMGAIKPHVLRTSEAVKKYDIAKRKCIYGDERKLSTFKIYSRANCQIECLNNLTLSSINCSIFFVPRDNKTNICLLRRHLWVLVTEYIHQMSDVYSQVHKKINSTILKLHCNCLPLCTDLSYNVQPSQLKWNWRQPYKAINNSTFEKDVSLSRLTLYFTESHFVASERRELYGHLDFVSNFGGLLGLFCGFSLISVVELLYFLTLRIFSNIRLYGDWAG